MNDAKKRTGYLWNTLYGWVDTGSGGLFPADPASGLQPISGRVPLGGGISRHHARVSDC